MAPIERIFVLAFENRSFDHLLGFSGIQGTDPKTGSATAVNGLSGAQWSNPNPPDGYVLAQTGAPFAITDKGPDHEFPAVQEQLYGPDLMYAPNAKNLGFVSSYQKIGAADPGGIMKCFTPDQLPVLTTLATQFGVCDQYHSSLPGPTWPNRFFLHAATSGGRTDSPAATRIVEADTVLGFQFKNGTIFNLLDKNLKGGPGSWAVYEGDEFPQAWGLYGMGSHSDRFIHMDQFEGDLLKDGFGPKYIFIEPSYGHVLSDYKGGTSQHPLDDVTSGERLLKRVYEAIRNSPYWETSLLIVTYDEHGGFYDHVIPPSSVPPGDTPVSGNDHQFPFIQLGFRVPALVISPYIPAGTVDHSLYDHSSIPATVEEAFTPGQHLTARDAQANTFTGLLSLSSPRSSEGEAPLRLPDPAPSQVPPAPLLAPPPADGAKPLDNTQAGFLHVAMLRHVFLEAGKKDAIHQRVGQIRTQMDAHRYMEEVKVKVRGSRKSGRMTP
jgi:phospholipase C